MKNILALLLAVLLTGCVSNRDVVPFFNAGEPTKTQMLVEASLIGITFYETREDEMPDKEARGFASIQEADNYLLFMYGKNALGEPKYTVSELVHGTLLSQIQDPRIKKLAYTARLILNKDGSPTGMSWAEAVVLGSELSQ